MSETDRTHDSSGWSLARIAQSRPPTPGDPGKRDAPAGAAGRSRRAPASLSADRPLHPAFTDLYRGLHGPLFRLAALLTDDPAVADTVVADAFVTLHRTWKAVRSDDGAWSYLVRLVLQRSRRAVRRSRPAGSQRTTGTASRHSPRCVMAGTATDDRPAITAAIRGLPQHQREAVVLVYLLDFSETDAAAAMCIRTATVRRLLAEGMTVIYPVLCDRS
jgi:RNA polymerase sigma factor (sigma-70 family)